jgi:hypothetical protein
LRDWKVMVLCVAALGCGHAEKVQGPRAPRSDNVYKVVVTAVAASGQSPIVIRDRPRIEAIAASFAFSESGWSTGEERDLPPAYRIDFHGRSRSTYWLGIYPPPLSMPIYFYSTWWVSPSTGTGAVVDKKRWKGLADTVKFKLFNDLGL